MTPPAIIIMIAIVLVLCLIDEVLGGTDVEKTTEFDTPKDELFYLIGHNLKPSNPKDLELPGPSSFVCIEEDETTKALKWQNPKFSKKSYLSCTDVGSESSESPLAIDL